MTLKILKQKNNKNNCIFHEDTTNVITILIGINTQQITHNCIQYTEINAMQ